MKYKVNVILAVPFGRGCGHKFPPETVGIYSRLWRARLAKWWAETFDERFPREYRIDRIDGVQATQKAEALRKRMKGTGWTTRIWENMGWHAAVQLPLNEPV